MAEEVQNLGTSEVLAPSPTPSEIAPSYEEIMPEAWEGRGFSAVEVLSALPGIQSYSQGGMGSFQTVSIRGIAARNILVCIDGVLLNDAGGGGADLNAIDLNNIEKIEIYKDRVPAKFGGAGLGGAINFVTKSALGQGKKSSGKVLVSYGSFNTFEGSAQVSATPKDSMQFSATASMRHSDNDYEFTNRNGTLYNTDDDFMDRRNNAEFTEYSGTAQYRLLHSGGYFSTVSGTVMHTEAGNPGTEDQQTYVAHFTGDLAQLGYRLEFPALWDFLLLEAGVVGRFERNVSASYYPLDKIGFLSNEYMEYGLAGYRLMPELVGNFFFERGEGLLRLAATAERWEARGNIHDFGLERYTGSIAGSVDFALTHWMSLFVEGDILKTLDDIDGGKFLMPTGMNEIKDATDRDLSLSGMVQAKFGKRDGRFGGNLSFGRFYRQPQLMELYGVFQGTLSNPNLKDETALRFEAGAFASTPRNRTTLRATYFETLSENGIYWVTSGNLMKAFNIDKTHIRGVELELESRPVEFFKTILRGTLQDPRDDGENKNYNGNLLPGEPVQSYYAEGTVYLPFHLDLTFCANYRTRIYSDRANYTRQPDVARYNASLGWNPFIKTRLVFAVNNITNETYRNFYTPYPAPGREFRASFIQNL